MMNRKPMSKRTRFNVFKRDGFRCQYCGREVPEVILELDHIVPLAEGGVNDYVNLITSCRDCNRGKGCIHLKTPPADDAAVREHQLQVEERARAAAEHEAEIIDQMEYLIDVWNDLGRGSGYIERDGLRYFIEMLGAHRVELAMDIAKSRPRGNYWKYCCGVCHNWILEDSQDGS